MTDTITLPRAELQAALDALQSECDATRAAAADAISTRLAQQEEKPEPVACKHSGSLMTREQAIEHCRRRRLGIEPTEKHIAATIDAYSALFGDLVPADTTPPQREWQGLTDEEVEEFECADVLSVRAIEAKLKERNTP